MIEKIKNYFKDNTGFLIRLDDIAENMKWEYMDEAEILFDRYNIKPVLGVIPINENNANINVNANVKLGNFN